MERIPTPDAVTEKNPPRTAREPSRVSKTAFTEFAPIASNTGLRAFEQASSEMHHPAIRVR